MRRGGDEALLEHERRFGGGEGDLRVPADELTAALDALDPAVRAGLRSRSRTSRRRAGRRWAEDRTVTLRQGQRVTLRELPVRARRGLRARRPQPVPVERRHGRHHRAGGRRGGDRRRAHASHPVILAACALCGVDEVYRMGGAQAVAALAFGTESIAPST